MFDQYNACILGFNADKLQQRRSLTAEEFAQRKQEAKERGKHERQEPQGKEKQSEGDIFRL